MWIILLGRTVAFTNESLPVVASHKTPIRWSRPFRVWYEGMKTGVSIDLCVALSFPSCSLSDQQFHSSAEFRISFIAELSVWRIYLWSVETWSQNCFLMDECIWRRLPSWKRLILRRWLPSKAGLCRLVGPLKQFDSLWLRMNFEQIRTKCCCWLTTQKWRIEPEQYYPVFIVTLHPTWRKILLPDEKHDSMVVYGDLAF